jgi:hypothetical protein
VILVDSWQAPAIRFEKVKVGMKAGRLSEDKQLKSFLKVTRKAILKAKKRCSNRKGKNYSKRKKGIMLSLHAELLP